MNPKYLYFLLLFVPFTSAADFFQAAKEALPAVYAVVQSDDTAKINAQLAVLENASLKERDAYRGALMMRKSGVGKAGLENLNLFVKGKRMLENCIRQDSLNAEYRFLRLIIQEHVPDFLNYHSKRQEDAKMIRQSYKKLSPGLQEAIRSYSRNSKVLKPDDFQTAGR